MNSKERVLIALKRETPDKVPFNFWMDRRLMERFEKKYGHRHWRAKCLGADVIETFPHLNFPIGEGVDKYGSFWIQEPYLKDWKKYDEIPMPDPNDSKVYELIEKDVKEFPDKAIFLDTITPWGVIAGLRTYEHIYMDMYEYPEEFLALTEKILDVQKTMVRKACKMGISALYIMEDLAISKGLAFSPKMINKFCLKYAKELADIAHENNIPVLFHSDGNVEKLIDLLIPLDVSAVNPLQPHLNSISEFKEKYGEKLTVYGGIDNCFTIPDSTEKEVRNHIRETFEVLGRPNGGLIFSSHDIPINTPEKNIYAMIDAIKECVY